MKHTLQGVKKSGSWIDIVEFGEKVEAALEIIFQENDITEYEEELETFREWRPKIDDKTEDDVEERTADSVAMNEPTETVKDNMHDATESMKDASTHMKNDPKQASKDAKDSANSMKTATETGLQKGIRSVEQYVYKNIMTAISPYYFDNRLFSASLSKNSDTKYTLEVNLDEDSLITDLQQELSKISDNLSRWHVESPTPSTESGPKDAENYDHSIDESTGTLESLKDEERRKSYIKD